MAYRGYYKTYNFTKFKTMRAFGEDIRNLVLII